MSLLCAPNNSWCEPRPPRLHVLRQHHFDDCDYVYEPFCHPDCSQCGSTDGCELAGVRTAYASGEQPNPWLCVECRADWHEHWDTAWDAYYSGLM